MATGRRADIVALAVLAVGALVVFAPAVGGDVALVRDVPGLTYPLRAFWRASVLEGHLPAWNPYVGLGSSSFAAPVFGAAYPGNLLLLAGPLSFAFGLTWLVHAIAAGWGSYALARAARVGRVSAIVSSLVPMIGGYAVSMWGNGEKTLTYAWLPWAACGIVNAAVRRSRAWVVVAAGAVAAIALAGDPFVWLHAVALGVIVAFAVAGGRAWRRIVVGAGLAVVLGALLAAPSLLPAMILRDETERGAPLALATAQLWSMHPARLLELVAPQALGDPLAHDLARYPGATLAEDPTRQALPWAISLYAGAACVVFAPLAGRARASLALWGLAAAATWAALGRHAAFEAVLRAVLPPLRYMRYPEKHAVVAIAALALLCGMGLDRVLARRVRPWHVPLPFAAAATIAIVAAPATFRATTAHALWAHAAPAAALLVGVALLAQRRRFVAPLVAVVALGDLAVAARGSIRWTDARALAERPAVAAAVAASTVRVPRRVFRPEGDHLDVASLPGDLGGVWGVAAFPGHDPTRSALVRALGVRLESDPGKAVALFRFDWLLLPPSEPTNALLVATTASNWHLHHVKKWSRAWLVRRVERLDDAAAIERIASATFDPDVVATVAPSPDDVAPPSATSPPTPTDTAPVNACRNVAYEADAVTVACVASERALLVVGDAWARGWAATVDDHDAPLVRADVVYRGVWVPSGSHTIVFRYRPPGLAVSFALALAGVLACAALVVGARRRSRPSPFA